jgi:hypothetical protein
MVRQILKYVTLSILLALTIFFCMTAIGRLSLPFENGRFFDEANFRVIEEQSILVYCLLSAFSMLLTIVLTINIFRTQRNYDK